MTDYDKLNILIAEFCTDLNSASIKSIKLGTLFSDFLAALAEILSVKDIPGRKLYYVHYIDCEYGF